jgi:hypothetical protein
MYTAPIVKLKIKRETIQIIASTRATIGVIGKKGTLKAPFI